MSLCDLLRVEATDVRCARAKQEKSCAALHETAKVSPFRSVCASAGDVFPRRCAAKNRNDHSKRQRGWSAAANPRPDSVADFSHTENESAFSLRARDCFGSGGESRARGIIGAGHGLCNRGGMHAPDHGDDGSILCGLLDTFRWKLGRTGIISTSLPFFAAESE